VPGGAVKASCRASDSVDVQEICKQFGGGGHKAAASVTLQGPLEEAKKKLLPLLFERAARMERN